MQEGPGPRPFDVTGNYLLELDPRAWLEWLGLTVDGPVQTIESDVGTVLAEVDKVVRVNAPSPWLAHIELQASRDPRLPSRLLQYHALLNHRDDLPVESTVVLLRPEANGPEMSGRYELRSASGRHAVSFSYRVVRLWERPVEELLRGGLGVLPLAPLASVEPSAVPDLIQRLDERFSQEADPTRHKELGAATHFMLGLRYDPDQIQEWVRSMSWLRESSTYQAVLEEGRAKGRAEGRAEGSVAATRQLLLELGVERLGPPDASTARTIEGLDDLEALRALAHRIYAVTSWQELLSPEPNP